MTAKATTAPNPVSGFEFKPNGKHISAADAEILGRRFVELADNGEVTPAQIVADARKPSSPIHRFFEWDIQTAAEKYWLQQAGALIRSVAIEITYADGSRERTRAFHSVEVDDERGYAPMTRVFSDAALTKQVLSSALRELDGWSQRYSRYQQLGSAAAFVRKATVWLRKHIEV